ncbi:ATP-binding protein [bacterium]|nr:ATP-binding protein [bacterium]
MKRALLQLIQKDISKKIILVAGPRQCGKTTLSKMLGTSYDYLNYDNDEDRQTIESKTWDRKKTLLILDELHKMPKWKNWLKGIYDVEGLSPQILVTGSARMDTFKKAGDSLAGRHFSFRLHPFDLKELQQYESSLQIQGAFERLLNIGGFPEPYLTEDPAFYKRWRRTHLDIIIKQDLIVLENTTNITGIENLLRLLRTRVGSTISYTNLARDLAVDPKTIKSWLDILERLYVIFKVTPYSKKIKETLLKAPKYYFYDNGQVEGDEGVKLENLTACALLKEAHYLQDGYGEDIQLHFLRTKKGDEIDFLVTTNQRPTHMIEVKWADDQPSRHFAYFAKFLPEALKIQIVGNLKREKTTDQAVEVRSAAEWLANLDLKT